jgi:dsDNA-specific endonuclease/ATPase MutS2
MLHWMKLLDWFKSAPPVSISEEAPLAEDEDPFTEPVVWKITDSIDLHGVAPRDVQSVVAAYLEESHARGFTRVRIIHGKGIGVQRQAVRNLLARTSFVTEFYDAPDASGWGATIAQLKDIQSKSPRS